MSADMSMEQSGVVGFVKANGFLGLIRCGGLNSKLEVIVKSVHPSKSNVTPSIGTLMGGMSRYQRGQTLGHLGGMTTGSKTFSPGVGGSMSHGTYYIPLLDAVLVLRSTSSVVGLRLLQSTTMTNKLAIAAQETNRLLRIIDTNLAGTAEDVNALNSDLIALIEQHFDINVCGKPDTKTVPLPFEESAKCCGQPDGCKSMCFHREAYANAEARAKAEARDEADEKYPFAKNVDVTGLQKMLEEILGSYELISKHGGTCQGRTTIGDKVVHIQLQGKHV